MKDSLPKLLLLVASTSLMASCGGSRNPDSSSSVADSSSSSSSISEEQKDPEEYLNDYLLALRYAAYQQDFSFSLSGGPVAFGLEMTEMESENPSAWKDLSLSSDALSAEIKINAFGRGREKMAASLAIPQTIFKASGSSLPSFIGNNTLVPIEAKAYLENGTFYADLSRQTLLNYILQLGIRTLFNDPSWELVDQGNHVLTDKEFNLLQGLCSYISASDPTDRFFAPAYDVIPENFSFVKTGDLERMTVRVDDEGSLKTLLMAAYEDISAALDEFSSYSYSLSSMEGSWGTLEMPTVEEFENRLDLILEGVDFRGFLHSVEYSSNAGVVSESFALDIESFDHETIAQAIYGEEPLDYQSQSYILPAGAWKLNFDIAREYGSKKVSADRLTEEEKADYSTPFTFPTWNQDGTASGDANS